MRVLVVEDETMLLTALSEEFKKRGIIIDSAVDGREALAKLNTPRPYDVVVLDLVIPFVSGLEVLHAIRENKKWKDVSVVVLTNLSDERTISSIIAAGGTDYLVKSDYTLKEVVSKILEIASRPRFNSSVKSPSPRT